MPLSTDNFVFYISLQATECSGRALNLYSTVFFNLYIGGGIRGPLGTAVTSRPLVPAPGDYDDGEIGGMIGRGKRSTRRKSAPLPLCPPHNPHAARTRTWAADSQQLPTSNIGGVEIYCD
jgi:hypothetical protein